MGFSILGIILPENNLIEELWRSTIWKRQKSSFLKNHKNCIIQRRKLKSIYERNFSPIFQVWLIKIQVFWNVLLPKHKIRFRVSHRRRKKLKSRKYTFSSILNRLVWILIKNRKKSWKKTKKSFVIILQPSYLFENFCQKSKIPLKLCWHTKNYDYWPTQTSWNWRRLFMKYSWSLGIDLRWNGQFCYTIGCEYRNDYHIFADHSDDRVEG